MQYRNVFLLFIVFVSPAISILAANPVKTTKVLFVGNSLTYTNQLPAVVEEMAKLDGKAITSTSFLYPDYSLEDHWNDGQVEDAIEKGNYDFVVFQQGPSALPESQILLVNYATRFAAVCKKHNSTMLLYMVWPSKARLFDLDGVINSYTKAAEKTNSLLCPAGLAWKYAWQADPSITLYGPDGFHPGIDGSVLAALTIYGVLGAKKDFDFLEQHKCSWKDQITGTVLGVFKTAVLKTME